MGANLRFTPAALEPYRKALHGVLDRSRGYLERSGDRGMLEVAAPFLAFRGLVMANPLWRANAYCEA
jgi:hypothetical protein